MPADPTQSVEQAINRLRSLHNGDAGVLEAVACRQRAIPALRALLFERELSGFFQSRCRAVEVPSLGIAFGLAGVARFVQVTKSWIERLKKSGSVTDEDCVRLRAKFVGAVGSFTRVPSSRRGSRFADIPMQRERTPAVKQ